MALVPGDVVRLPVPRVDLRRAVRQRLRRAPSTTSAPSPATGRRTRRRTRTRRARVPAARATLLPRRAPAPFANCSHIENTRPTANLCCRCANSRGARTGAGARLRAYTRRRCPASPRRSPACAASPRGPRAQGSRPRRRRPRRPSNTTAGSPRRSPVARRIPTRRPAPRRTGCRTTCGCIMHWVPFDEARLQKLLHSSRTALWQWLRNDVQTLAELARSTAGRRPRSSPRRSSRRARRTSRRDAQGAARADAARARPGPPVPAPDLPLAAPGGRARGGGRALRRADTETFQRLRRLDLSPLRIGRTHGRTRHEMQAGLERRCAGAARDGVERRRHVAAPGADRPAAPAAPGAALARRGSLQRPAADDGRQAALPVPAVVREPVLSGDGRIVLFDARAAAPPLAVRYGEVVLEGRNLATGAQFDPRDASPARSLIALLELRPEPVVGRHRSWPTRCPPATGRSPSATATSSSRSVTWRPARCGSSQAAMRAARGDGYDPALSDDGNVVAYQSVIADPMSPSTNWATRVRVRDLRDGAAATASRAPAPTTRRSRATGGVVAFTSYSREHLQVFAYDRSTRTVTLVSRIGGRAPSAPPSVGAVAVAAMAGASRSRRRGPRRPRRVYVRDLRERTSHDVSGRRTAASRTSRRSRRTAAASRSPSCRAVARRARPAGRRSACSCATSPAAPARS